MERKRGYDVLCRGQPQFRNQGGGDIVLLDTVDSLGAPADYIKYDVEGAEREALLGSRETILHRRPDLLVSAYHRSEDLFDLPLLLHGQFPFYELRLRRFPYVPAWDINLYATVNRKKEF